MIKHIVLVLFSVVLMLLVAFALNIWFFRDAGTASGLFMSLSLLFVVYLAKWYGNSIYSRIKCHKCGNNVFSTAGPAFIVRECSHCGESFEKAS